MACYRSALLLLALLATAYVIADAKPDKAKKGKNPNTARFWFKTTDSKVAKLQLQSVMTACVSSLPTAAMAIKKVNEKGTVGKIEFPSKADKKSFINCAKSLTTPEALAVNAAMPVRNPEKKAIWAAKKAAKQAEKKTVNTVKTEPVTP